MLQTILAAIAQTDRHVSPATGQPRLRALWRRLALGAAVGLLACAPLLTLPGCTRPRDPEKLRTTLVFAYDGTFKSFDTTQGIYAQEGAIVRQVIEPLVEYDRKLELTGVLAESWETPDDGKTWIFHLRKGVKFHDGTPFDAGAVRWHFKRTLDPATLATRAKRISDLEHIDTPDSHTVVMRLKGKNSQFIDILTSNFAAIPSPANFAKLGKEIGKNPVGTGPYRFKGWGTDEVIRFEKYAEHRNADKYPIEALEFRRIQENTTRLIMLEQEAVDVAPINFAHVKALRNRKDLDLQTVPILAVGYVGFNTQKPPFNDVRVRQALNYAVNKEELIKYGLFGLGEPPAGPIPPPLPDHNPNVNPYKYDPEKAKKLLAEAGYPNGIDIVFWTSEVGQYRLIADSVVGYLEKAGMRVKVKIFDNAQYWSQFEAYLTPDGKKFPTKEGVFDMFVGGWFGGESAYGFLEPLFRSDSSSNSTFYDEAEVDELIRKVKDTSDLQKKREYLWRLQEKVVNDAPWIFSIFRMDIMAVNPRVEGFRVDPAGWYRFDGVRLLTPEETKAKLKRMAEKRAEAPGASAIPASHSAPAPEATDPKKQGAQAHP